MDTNSHSPSSSDSSGLKEASLFPSRALHGFAIVTAAAVLPLIFIGGLVTSHDAALAVPDWPTSFGYNMFLFPWDKWVGGIFYEHSHRLAGSLVGLLTMILCFWLYLKEPRAWVKRLGAIALLAVIIQGILGGLRVELVFKPIAIFHACIAQAIFCLISSIALFTSPYWQKISSGQLPNRIEDNTLKKLAIFLTSAVFIQLILGAIMRHTESGLAIPDFPRMYGHWSISLDANNLNQINEQRVWKWNLDRVNAAQILIHLSHRLWAIVVATLTLALFLRISTRYRQFKQLWRLSVILLAFLVIQISLGMSVIWYRKAADIATAHVAFGALTLVTSFLITVLVCKFVKHEKLAEHPVVGTSEALT